MTISTTEPRISYAGDGSTTSFAVPFSFDADTDLTVEIITNSTNAVVAKALTSEFTVSGSNVVMGTAPASGETLVITLGLDFEQATDYTPNDPFPAETHENALDELSKQIKELKEDIDNRCIKLPTNLLASTTVTGSEIGANKTFRINSTGTGLKLSEITTDYVAVEDPWDLSEFTSHMLPPTGTTAQRTGVTAGETRFNTTDNKLEYYNGTSWVQLEAPTAPPPAGMTLISVTTISNDATVDLDNIFTSTYDVYKIVVDSMVPGANSHIHARVGTGATPTYQSGSSDYMWSIGYRNTSSSSDFGDRDATATELALTGDDAVTAQIALSGGIFNMEMTVYNPLSSTEETHISWDLNYMPQSGNPNRTTGHGIYDTTTAVTSLQLLQDTGSITSGTVRVYGLTKSIA